MVVGTGLVDLLIPESGSLKEKRSVLKRIIQKTRNEFNVSIAEVGDNDLWRRARVGFSVVGNDKQYVNAKMDHILRFIDRLMIAEVLRSRIEIVSFDDLMDAEEIEEGKYE
ncbi:MAG: DUF503 domain-containing protein [Syntrophales bacterium]